MTVLERIRSAVRSQNYRISAHANEEMSEDDLDIQDVEMILLGGRLSRKFTRDPRGTRYEVRGRTSDRRDAIVVVRFVPSTVLVIITAYVQGETDEETEK